MIREDDTNRDRDDFFFFFSNDDATQRAQMPFQHERGRTCGQLGSSCQGQKYICVDVRMWKDVCVGVCVCV